MTVLNPLVCEKCGQELPPDDAIAVIEGICTECRETASPTARQFPSEDIVARHDTSTLDPFPPRRETATPRPPRPSIPTPAAIPDRAERHRSEFETPLPPPRHKEARVHPPQLPPRPGPTVPSANRSQLRKRRWRRGIVGGIAVGLLLSVCLTGYFLVEQRRHENGDVRKTLAAASLTLTITPRSAVVKLDGAMMPPPDAWGKIHLPLAGGGLDDRILEISAEGYRPIRQPLSAYKGAPEAFIELLRPPFELAVVTNPPEADVFINDELKGRSPIKLVVGETDGAKLKVCKEGYHPLAQNLHPPASGDQLDLDLNLAPIGPIIAVETEPRGALIAINGMTRGSSPLEVELDGADLGREAKIVATAPGYESATLTVTLPEIGGGEPTNARIALAPHMARIEIETDPPGGRVVIGGRDFGEAPALVEFEGTETGKTLVVEASRDDSYSGRQVLTVPPVGETMRLIVPMAFSAHRVVFLLAIPPGVGFAHHALADHLATRIHQLEPSQRFAILTAVNGGIESWPPGREMETGTIEQKIRAYDVVRTVRPTERIDLDQLLQTSLAYEPTTIWMFVEDELDPMALERFGAMNDGDPVSVHVVRATADPDEEMRLHQWTAHHHGTLTLLGQQPRSAVALDDDAE